MKKILIAISALFLSSLSFAETIQCKVVGVNDGDTITCLTADKQQIKVRLNQIDAPELGQAFGQKSKQALSDLVFNKQVNIKVSGIDKYKRTLGTVLLPVAPYAYSDINLKMVSSGMAWAYTQYVTEQHYFAVQDNAKNNKLGIWSQPNPIPPWEYRKTKKNGSQITVSGGAAFTCGTKQYCKEMKSCDEAKFYLKQCGVSSLDGNNDGMPCNKLCRR